MSGELEPYEQSPAEMETEFGSYPEEIRRAALEYARGLYLDVRMSRCLMLRVRMSSSSWSASSRVAGPFCSPARR